MTAARCPLCGEVAVTFRRLNAAAHVGLVCPACYDTHHPQASLFDPAPDEPADPVPTISVKPSAFVVYEAMRLQGPRCPWDFMRDSRTARYSARIGELRELGIVITKTRCGRHQHTQRAWEYAIDFAATGPIAVTARTTVRNLGT